MLSDNFKTKVKNAIKDFTEELRSELKICELRRVEVTIYVDEKDSSFNVWATKRDGFSSGEFSEED